PTAARFVHVVSPCCPCRSSASSQRLLRTPARWHFCPTRAQLADRRERNMPNRKVILNQEVDGLGAAGDVVEVRAGYARNLLLPRGWASAWSAGVEKHIEALRKTRRAKQIADHDEAVKAKSELESTTARIDMKAGKNGRLFGAVTPALVAEA